MKRTILSIFAVLALLAAMPAMAQEQQITGTVVSHDGDILVLSTDQGEMTFSISDVDVPATVVVNDEITVWYEPGDAGDLVASRVTLSTDIDAGMESDLTADTDTDVDLEADARIEDTDADIDADLTADLDDDQFDDDLAADDERLPATASSAPLAGLIGLLALGAALGLAVLIRRGA